MDLFSELMFDILGWQWKVILTFHIENLHSLPAMVGLHRHQRVLHFPSGGKVQCRLSAPNFLSLDPWIWTFMWIWNRKWHRTSLLKDCLLMGVSSKPWHGRLIKSLKAGGGEGYKLTHACACFECHWIANQRRTDPCS